MTGGYGFESFDSFQPPLRNPSYKVTDEVKLVSNIILQNVYSTLITVDKQKDT